MDQSVFVLIVLLIATIAILSNALNAKLTIISIKWRVSLNVLNDSLEIKTSLAVLVRKIVRHVPIKTFAFNASISTIYF